MLGPNRSDKQSTTDETIKERVQNQWEVDMMFCNEWVRKIFHNTELFPWYRKKF